MVDRLHNLLSRHRKRAIALLTALAVLAGSIGIPVPRPAMKDTSRPFPCMHHACGCASADECWRGCCCMSREQKLEWAEKHHVRPPAVFAASAAQPLQSRPQQGAGSCCSSEKCDQDQAASSAAALAVHLLRIEDVRKCQGLSPLWLLLSQALPPAEQDSLECELTLVSWLAPASTSQVASPAFDPATPPPRAAI